MNGNVLNKHVRDTRGMPRANTAGDERPQMFATRHRKTTEPGCGMLGFAIRSPQPTILLMPVVGWGEQQRTPTSTCAVRVGYLVRTPRAVNVGVRHGIDKMWGGGGGGQTSFRLPTRTA